MSVKKTEQKPAATPKRTPAPAKHQPVKKKQSSLFKFKKDQYGVKTVTEYNSSGKKIKEDLISEGEKIEFLYGKKGRLIKSIYESPKMKSYTDHHYDKKGKMIAEDTTRIYPDGYKEYIHVKGDHSSQKTFIAPDKTETYIIINPQGQMQHTVKEPNGEIKTDYR